MFQSVGILKFDPIISVSLVDNEFIHKMNKEYRGIDRPTDVISFAFLDNEDRASLYNKTKHPLRGSTSRK